MPIAGELIVKISADLSSLDRDLKEADRKISNVGKGVSLKGIDDALAGVGSSFQALSTKMLQVGVGLTAGLTVPIAAAVAAIGKTAFAFDDAFDHIRIGTGKTGEALAGLEQSFRRVVADVPASFEAAGQAISALAARTGLTGQALEDLGKAELELSRITGTDLGAQIQTTTRLFGDWGVSVGEQIPKLDALFRASQAGGGNIDELARKLVQFGAPLRQMGFGLDQSIALLSKFEKEGVNTELVLGSLRIALTRMAKEGIKDPSEALQVFTQRIQDAGSAGRANAIAMEVFGARAGPDMAAAIREGRFALDAMIKAISGGSDTIAGAALQTQDFGEKWELFKNKMMLAVEPLADRLFPALEKLQPVMEKIIGATVTVIEKFAALPEPVQLASAALLAVAATSGPIITAGSQIVGALGTIRAAMVTLQATAWTTRLAVLGAVGAGAALGAYAIGVFGPGGELEKEGITPTAAEKSAMDLSVRQFIPKPDTGVAALRNLWDTLDEEIEKGGKPRLKKKAGEAGAGIPAGFGEGVKGGHGKAKEAVAAMIDGVLIDIRKYEPELFAGFKKLGDKSQAAFKEALGRLGDAVSTILKRDVDIEKVWPFLDEETKKRFNEMYERTEELKKRTNVLEAAFLRAGSTMESSFENGRIVIRDTSVAMVDSLGKLGDMTMKTTALMGDQWVRMQGEYVGGLPVIKRSVQDVFDAVIKGEKDFEAKQEETREKLHQQFLKMDEDFKSAISKIEGTFGRGFSEIIKGTLSAIGQLNTKSLNAINAWGEDVFGLLADFPGHWGEALRKTESEVEKWVNFLDRTIRVVERLFGESSPEGLGGIISKLVGNFQQGGASIQNSIGGIIGAVSGLFGKGGGGGTIAGLPQGKTTIGGILGSMPTVLPGIGTLGAGAAGAGAAGAGGAGLLGISALGGPVGLAIGAGVSLLGPLLGGLFKSGHQKRMEKMAEEQKRLEIDGLKENLKKMYQETMQAAIQTMQDALALFDQLPSFAEIPKSFIKGFFKNLHQVLDMFADLAGDFSSEMLEKMKVFAEGIGPAINLIGAGVGAFESLSGFLGLPQVSVTAFAAGIERVINTLGEVADTMEKRSIKVARRLAEKMGEIVELVGGGVGAFKDLFDFKEIPATAIDAFGAGIQLAVTKFMEVNQSLDQFALKQVSKAAERMRTIVDVIGAGVESLTKLREFQSVPAEIFQEFSDNIALGINQFQKTFEAIDVELLARTATIAERTAGLFDAFKAIPEIFNVIRDYKPISEFVFRSILMDFDSLSQLVENLMDRATRLKGNVDAFVEVLKSIKDALSSVLGAGFFGSGGGAAGGGLPFLPGLPHGSIDPYFTRTWIDTSADRPIGTVPEAVQAQALTLQSKEQQPAPVTYNLAPGAISLDLTRFRSMEELLEHIRNMASRSRLAYSM